MQTFFPRKRLPRILSALAILLIPIIIGIAHDPGSGWFGLGCWCLMLAGILALQLLNCCRVELRETVLAFHYPFRPVRRRHVYGFEEIAEVVLSAYGESPAISIVFKERFRRETLYSEGRSRELAHCFGRRQTAEIAGAMRVAGLQATAVDYRIRRKG